MQAIQFDARVHDGVIGIPPQYRDIPKQKVIDAVDNHLRAERGNRERFLVVLDKAPDVQLEDNDR